MEVVWKFVICLDPFLFCLINANVTLSRTMMRCLLNQKQCEEEPELVHKLLPLDLGDCKSCTFPYMRKSGKPESLFSLFLSAPVVL